MHPRSFAGDGENRVGVQQHEGSVVATPDHAVAAECDEGERHRVSDIGEEGHALASLDQRRKQSAKTRLGGRLIAFDTRRTALAGCVDDTSL